MGMLEMTSRVNHSMFKESCRVIDVEEPYPSYVAKRDVHIIENSQNEILFRDSRLLPRNQASNTSELLNNLKKLSPSVADHFVPRPDALKEVTMRLVNPQETPRRGESSYLALSYCWGKGPGGVKPTATPGASKYSLPISPPLFKALLKERGSEVEGIWCDQICINQEDKKEKAIAINATDIIYSCAREVVIALDDIEISKDEQLFISEYINMLGQRQDHTTNSPLMQSNSALRLFFEKILAAKWFERAWCAHEMRHGSRHVFLVPCESGSASRPKTVLRFSGLFFSHLLALAIPVNNFKPRIYDVLPALVSVFGASEYTEYLAHSQASVEVGSVEGEPSSMDAQVDGQGLSSALEIWKAEIRGVRNTLGGTILRVFLEIFELDAGGNPTLDGDERVQDANQDKLSIVLNSFPIGLAYKRGSPPRPPAVKDECCRKILLLALAMGDPLTLCTTGPPLQLNESATSWLTWPEMSDIQENLPSIVSAIESSTISVDQSETTEFIQLDIICLHPRSKLGRPSDCFIDVAKRIVTTYLKWSQQRARARPLFWDSVIAEEILLRDRETETLACMLECDVSWVLQAAKTCGYGGYESLRTVCTTFFKNTFRNLNWDSMIWLSGDDGEAAVENLLQFAYHMTIVGIPWSGIDDPEWRPVLISTGSTERQLVYSLADQQVVMSVPKVLKAVEYASLPRVWILKPRRELSYTLLGKSRMFGSTPIADFIEPYWALQESRLVYGPELIPE